MSITPPNTPKTQLEIMFRRMASDASRIFDRKFSQQLGGLVQGGALNAGALFGNVPISNLGGLKWKEPVFLVSTNNVTKSGSQTIDGTSSGTAGDRILLRGQTTTSENGIWTTASGAWSRAADMDSSDEFSGAAVVVLSGSSLARTAWYCSNATPPTVGSTAITWVPFPITAHSHTRTAGDGGAQTNDVHEHYSEYEPVLVDPGTPSTTGAFRIFNRDFTNSGVRPYIPIIKDALGITHDLKGDIDTLARNVTGSTIAATVPVYFSGNETGTTLGPFDIALADGDDTSKLPAVGITLSSVTDGGYTMVRRLGYIRGLDTSAFSAGDTLYPGTTAGTLTATRPAAYTPPVARVIRAHASAGVIYVAPPSWLGLLGALDHTHSGVGDGGAAIALNGTLTITGTISPSITSNQNDWSPTGLATAYTIEAAPTAARTITGIAAQGNGRRILIINNSTFDLTLSHESASSSAANRFFFAATAADATVKAKGALELVYNGTLARWLPI